MDNQTISIILWLVAGVLLVGLSCVAVAVSLPVRMRRRAVLPSAGR